MFKLFLLFSVALVSNYGMANFPHKPNTQEIRLLASSTKGISEGGWLVEGQMIGVKSKNKLSLSGVFGMSQEKAHLGAEIIYSLNPIVFISLTGMFENTAQLGAHTRIFLDLPLAGETFALMPFVSLNHKKVASFGAIVYFNIRGIMFSLGSSYKPPLGDNETHNVSFMLGTGFKTIKQVQ